MKSFSLKGGTEAGYPRFKFLNRISHNVSDRSNNPTLEWLVAHFGASRAFELCQLFATTRVHVPKRNSGLHSSFCGALTETELAAFQREWAGLSVQLPMAKAFRAEFMAVRQGQSISEIAAKLQMRETSVRRALTDASNADLIHREVVCRDAA